MVERGCNVRVRDFADGKVVEHPTVLLLLVLLEELNGHVAVVNRHEVNQLTVVFDLFGHVLNLLVVDDNIFLDRCLGLEKRF